MTREETALDVLKPVLEAMRDEHRKDAASGPLDEKGDQARRVAAHGISLLDDIENRIRMKIGVSNG